MSTDLVLPATVTMTATGLDVPRGIPREEWERVGSALGQIDRKLQWMVGDWINAGEREGYVSRDTYDAAERLFPQLSRKTLQEYASVARKSSIRMEDLSFKHHQVVSSLPAAEQAERLTETRDNGWSVSKLRENITKETTEGVAQCCPTCGRTLPRGVQIRTPRRSSHQ